MARSILAAGELARGPLVRPFELALPSDRSYHVVAPRARPEKPAIRAFREWLIDQGRA